MQYKHKKTRKQKIIADYRHQVYILENQNTSFNISAPSVTPNKNSFSYSYVLADVVKTGLLTTLIIIAELILFFLLKNHIIIIPKITY